MTNQAIDTPPLLGALFFRLFLPSLLQLFRVRPWRWRYVHSIYRLSMVKQPQTFSQVPVQRRDSLLILRSETAARASITAGKRSARRQHSSGAR